MKIAVTLAFSLLLTLSPAFAPAQSNGQQSLASTLGIYVFPSKGQSATQQSEDEAACYKWAVSNTGTDPFAAQKQQTENAQQSQAAQAEIAQSGQGAGARGAVGGAAVGALVGAIGDDAGKGAAWGAGIGLIAGRRHRRHEQAEASSEVAAQSAQVQQTTQAQLDGFKKAFSACMEGKDYIAKI